MPWNGRTPVDLRLEFIARLNNGERMTDLCVEYGVSRKTGHKLKARYEELGPPGLEDQSRAPKVIPHRTAPEVVALILETRRQHPTWGPRKLKEVLETQSGRTLPSASTLGGILSRNGLTERRPARRRYPASLSPISSATAPNDIWCTDYKGQFRLGDRSYCYPLTITDLYSRYILGCDGMSAISDEEARASFEMVFRSHGIPGAMRSDNGIPFASSGLANLTKLSVYWLRLGIRLERIRKGKPQDNGQHERMHRTLKQETTRPARGNLLQQQEAFDNFVDEFNNERPHDALEMKRPAQVYEPSVKRHPEVLTDPEYPTHDDTIRVTSSGSIYLYRRKQIYLGAALSGEYIGIREQDDGRWLLTFMAIDLGHVESDDTFTPLTHPQSGNN